MQRAFKIKKAMAQKNLNAKELAKNVPMNYIYLLEIINNKKTPSTLMACKIANALEVDVSDLFDIKEVETHA